jgi:hypothetical protein
MEQPCYKCGQTVEEGVPFCPHCAAPQIRVVIAEAAPPPLAFAAAASTSEDSAVLPASQTLPVLALPVQWSQSVGPCALAALVASILMALGLHPFVAMLSVGFLAVVFYRQRRPEIRIKARTGAALGALGGLLWFAMSSIMEVLIVIFLHKGPELRTALVARIQEAASQTTDPQVLAMFERFKTPGGLEFLMLTALILAFFASLVLGGLGGALGSAILGRRAKS